MGQEPTSSLFIEHLLSIFREVRRVLRDDGLLFVNIADGYAQDKSLHLVPERFSIAMQDDGWIVRQKIIWAKKAPMPESVRDRFTRSWEPIFMFAKSGRYFFDQDAVRQTAASDWGDGKRGGSLVRKSDPENRWQMSGSGFHRTGKEPPKANPAGANMRDVWHLGPSPLKEAHYASFPPEIPKRCILAGSRRGDTVLDPFLGSGTTVGVAAVLGREGWGIELNEEYSAIAEKRIRSMSGRGVEIIGHERRFRSPRSFRRVIAVS